MTDTKKFRYVIVEGPDCSGKSTLVERLKNSLRWDSKYLRHAEGNQFFRYLKEYSTQENIIFDRAHFSESVYSQMWRGGSPFNESEKEILDTVSALHGLVIFCLPGLTMMKERYKNRGFEQQITFDELEASQKLFQFEAENTNHILYRSSNYEELEMLIARVKEMII